MWKKIRILILLLILLVVALNAYRDQNQDWSKPIIVLLHPVNADGTRYNSAIYTAIDACKLRRGTRLFRADVCDISRTTDCDLLPTWARTQTATTESA